MMKRLAVFIISLVMALSMAGCSAKKEDVSTGETAGIPAGEAVQAETEEKSEEPAMKIEGSPKAEDAAKAEDSAMAEESDQAQEATAEGNNTGIVENNGGYFLKIGDEVYYRIQGENSLAKNAFNGEFLDSPNLDPAKGADSDYGSSIMKLNTGTQEITEAAYDFGYGPLFSDGKNLYLNEHDGDYTYVKYLSLDGSAEGRLGEGKIEGCSEASGLIAVSSMTTDTYESVLSLYRGSELVNKFSNTEGFYYAGIDENGAYFVTAGEEGRQASIYQLAGDGSEALCLGSCEAFDEGYAVFEQFLSTGDTVNFVISNRDGSAMMIQKVIVASAKPGQENSVSQTGVPDSFRYESGEPMLPVIYDDGSGKVAYASTAPGTAFLGSFEEGSNLMLTDETGKETQIITAFRLNPPGGDAVPERYVPQAAEYVGGDIYMIIALAERTPEEDIGWNESYGIKSMEYVRVDPTDKSELPLGVMKY